MAGGRAAAAVVVALLCVALAVVSEPATPAAAPATAAAPEAASPEPAASASGGASAMTAPVSAGGSAAAASRVADLRAAAASRVADLRAERQSGRVRGGAGHPRDLSAPRPPAGSRGPGWLDVLAARIENAVKEGDFDAADELRADLEGLRAELRADGTADQPTRRNDARRRRGFPDAEL